MRFWENCPFLLLFVGATQQQIKRDFFSTKKEKIENSNTFSNISTASSSKHLSAWDIQTIAYLQNKNRKKNVKNMKAYTSGGIVCDLQTKIEFWPFFYLGLLCIWDGQTKSCLVIFYVIMTANLPNPQKSHLHRRLAHRINAAAASIKKARCMIL